MKRDKLAEEDGKAGSAMSDFENGNLGEGSGVREEGEKPESSKEESLKYGDTVVPIRRANMPDMFIALEPPDASPYIMCSKEADPQTLVQFLSERVKAVEELRVDMRKRFAKNKSLRCLYKTGDVAYIWEGRSCYVCTHWGSQRSTGRCEGAQQQSTRHGWTSAC